MSKRCGTSGVELVISDENPSTARLKATSSDEQVVSNSDLFITGCGATRQLTITPASNTPGTATITLNAEDEADRTSFRAFALTLTEAFPTPTELPTENAALIGTAVAIGDKYAVVGAVESVYVFERVGDDRIEMQLLTPNVLPINPTDFGGAVDVDGERIIVGADEDFGGGDHAGAAYIFELIACPWT